MVEKATPTHTALSFSFAWQHNKDVGIDEVNNIDNPDDNHHNDDNENGDDGHWVVEKATPTHTALSFSFALQQYGCISFWANTVATNVFIFQCRL